MAYNHEDAPNTRLFIMCGKGASEEMLKKTFSKFGTIKDLWVVKDRRTNEEKGIAYITYTRTSEAALAMEEMNGRNMDGQPRPLKVVIANSKREGSVRDPKEEERILRLFVVIPKSFKEDDLRKEFGQFGDIDYVNVLRNKNGESKGFGYVKYFRPYHAAKAFEECEKSYKAMFAEPPRPKGVREMDDPEYYYDRGSGRGSKRSYDDDYGMGHSSGYGGPSGMSGGGGRYSSGGGGGRDYMPVSPSQMGPMDIMEAYPVSSQSVKLQIVAAIGLPQRYLSVLFSIVPGLEYCDFNESTGIGYARYSSPQCASYARDKLDGFEYPIGSQLRVSFADGGSPGPGGYSGMTKLIAEDCLETGLRQTRFQCNFHTTSVFSQCGREREGPDMRQKAALVLEQAGINPHQVLNHGRSAERVGYCNITLPPPKPLKPEDTPVMQRLFIVCQPSAVSEKILRDAFCRFGNLIDVYLLAGRNYGYAKFGSKESAMKAIQMLHGQHLTGQRLKVLEAEPPKNDAAGEGPLKKPRY